MSYLHLETTGQIFLLDLYALVAGLHEQVFYFCFVYFLVDLFKITTFHVDL